MVSVALLSALDEVPAAAWNALAGDHNPFLRHEFLAGLERHGCVGPPTGWIPHHLALFEDGRLAGAAPMYIKHNSYGELVFDWSWADAYRRLGLRYYPKLVVAVPYTPATGPRLLLGDGPDRERHARHLAQAGTEEARRLGVSSLHWLFTTDEDTRRLEGAGLMRRVGYQFHWDNRGYRDLADFLDGFTAEKRKKVKRERRHVREAGIDLEVLSGREVSDSEWALFHELYLSTFDKKGGYATLTLEFFRTLSETMPDSVVLVLARHGERIVAGALNLRGRDTLYGRHWGCRQEFHSLHFEVCYYTALEYCIAQGLKRFEAGAQGEHKLARGFLPRPTYSVHWLEHPGLRRAVADFLGREREAVQAYLDELAGHSPFKHTLDA